MMKARRKRLRLWILLFLLCLPFSPVALAQEVLNPQLLEKAEQFKQQIEAQDYPSAKQTIEEIAALFPGMRFDGATTLQGVHTLSSLILSLQHQLSSLQLEPGEIERLTTQFHLAVDALYHDENPLWKKSYNALKKPLQDLPHLTDKEEKMQHWQAIKRVYERTRPAMAVDISPIALNKADSLMAALEKLSASSTQEEWRDVANQLNETMQELYLGPSRSTLGEMLHQPLSNLILAFAAFLLVALGYTALRLWQARPFSS